MLQTEFYLTEPSEDDLEYDFDGDGYGHCNWPPSSERRN